jgi:glycosyltransferase involved in cell wall biosynthesis
MGQATVSILIPCYNAEKYIGETLESVFRQTWRTLEVIVVDDGSQDASVAEAKRFESAGLTILHQPNTGASAARNRAYRASSGDFIQFLDADDVIAPDKIALQMQRLIRRPLCITSCEWARFTFSPHQARFLRQPEWRDLDALDWLALSLRNGFNMMFPALWLIPRGIAEGAGQWTQELTVGDDFEYFVRVLLRSESVLFCKGARAYYRSGMPGSLSACNNASAWMSAFRGLEISTTRVLAREHSRRMRRAFAICFQQLAHGAYPYDAKLARSALKRAADLDPIRTVPDGGPAFQRISRILGWRLARRLQVAFGRQ